MRTHVCRRPESGETCHTGVVVCGDVAIRERGPGRYEVVVEAGTEQGRRRQVSRMFHGTELEALRYEERLKRDAKRGRLLPRDLDAPVAKTVGQLLEEWYAIAAPSWSPSTRRQTRSIIDGRLADLATMRLHRLQPHVIDRFYAGLLARELEPSTVRRIHGVLRRALVFAERWEWIQSNPAAKVEPPVLEEADILLPSFEGVRKMLEDMAVYDPTFGLFLRLAATTAARRGELSALRWGAWNEDYMVITHALVDAGPGEGIVEKGVKTKRKGNRLVGLTPATIEALRQHRLRCAEWGLATGEALGDRHWMFESTRRPGEPTRPDTFSQRWIRNRDDYGLAGVKLHHLRHFVGDALIDEGVPAPKVSAFMGHSKTSTTTDLYTHVTDARDPRIVAVLTKLVG